VKSPSGQLAFTNLPYVTDMGTSCGQNFVNKTNGLLDGVSIVEGHEYAETITDQFPAGGWTDSSGYETGDKCAWISSGQGAATDIALQTGSFAVQSTWGNDFNGGAGGCEVTDQINAGSSVAGTTNTVTITNPSGSQTTAVNTAVSVNVGTTDSGGASISSYAATGLPTGLSINASGVISGTATVSGKWTTTVSATDSTGVTGSATFTWTISNGGNDFSISASQSSLSVTRGQSSAPDVISAAITSGKAESVSLSASGLPPGATPRFNPTSITSGGSGSTLTISTSSTTPTGSYTITVTGSSGGTTHMITITLTVRRH
jgi:serine protease